MTDYAIEARRMARKISDAGTSRLGPLYFREDGSWIEPGGDHFYRGGVPGPAAYVVEYPFVPQIESCARMVEDRTRTGERVTYDETRWDLESMGGDCLIARLEASGVRHKVRPDLEVIEEPSTSAQAAVEPEPDPELARRLINRGGAAR